MIELFVMKRIWIIKLRKGLPKFMRVSRESNVIKLRLHYKDLYIRNGVGVFFSKK